MYFIQYVDSNGDGPGYIALSIDKVKEILCEVFKELDGDALYMDDEDSWESLNISIQKSSSFEDISEIVYEHSLGSSIAFRFSSVREGEEIDLMS
jgi:hypothetical protein